ncbi:DUF4307 domain-containing protein [Nocardioides stalactiti]|uniref:DUF4307 domain-containing protein n=1 Tax=Nocardioides stalactiti TaxID=2755356 RepID=UPI0016004266|nr:DUF4307 domain-containing protein [Nocardioides stalactiti]
MSAPTSSLAERYGAPPRWRRPLLLTLVVIVVGAFAALWTWITIEQSDPPVSSELVTSEITDDHSASAVIRITFGDGPVDARCTVRAIAHDKTIVGLAAFVPDPDEGPDYTVEIATERRATAVENVGCTAEGQPRPR